MNWKLTAAAASATVIVGWLAPTRPVTPAAEPPRTRADTRPDETDIQEQAVKLQSRLRGDSEYRVPERDLFRYSAGLRSTPPDVEALPAPDQQLPPRPAPMMSLTGIATDAAGGAEKRTAILSTRDGIVLAAEGDVAAGYRVIRITDELVVLESIVDGQILQLGWSSTGGPSGAPTP